MFVARPEMNKYITGKICDTSLPSLLKFVLCGVSNAPQLH